MSSSIFIRLSVMMFLQFFIWGAWYVTTGQYMEEMGLELSIGWVYTVGPIAAILSPLFLGMVADRYFASERVLGVLQLIGGVALLFSPQLAELSVGLWQDTLAGWEAAGLDPVEQARELWIIPAHLPFVGILFLHMLCYMPTLGLTNTLAFHNLTDQEKQFPLIRVFGTIGWIAAGLLVSYGLNADETAVPLQVAGVAGIALGLFSFFLPHTPPPEKGKKASAGELLGFNAIALMKDRSFAVFIIASMLICIPLAAYYAFAQLFVNHAGFYAPAGVMTIGQMSEIIFMLLMPLFFVRLGVKWMLMAGMLAWVLRYGLFALGASSGAAWMIIIGLLLHGICYDFFFVTGFIYTDQTAPKRIRGQAQGFLVLVTQGIGLGIGAQVMQRIANSYKAENYDALIAEADTLRNQHAALMEQAEAAGGQEATALMTQADAAWNQASDLLLQTYDWQQFWLVPCIFAAVIAVLFFLLFKKPKRAAPTSEGDTTTADGHEEHPGPAI